MKHFTTLALLLAVNFTISQAQKLDTVSMGASYSQQVWYKLETDKETKAPVDEWDLAFSAKSRDAAIWSNPKETVYAAVGSIANFSTLSINTATLTAIQDNSDTTWYIGSLNKSGDNVFDYGFGTYNTTTHNVTGDSVYVIKLIDGTTYKKFAIEKLVFDSIYIMHSANLDNTADRRDTIRKSDFNGKSFGYFSFVTNTKLDREPLMKDWDLLFTRYRGLTANQFGVLQYYPLTGVLHNPNVTVAKRISRDTTSDNFSNQSFKTNISTMGYDWKYFNGAAYTISDSTTYFVKTINGKIYKMIFTGFGGGANGNCIFTREYMLGTSVAAAEGSTATLAVSPNPATDGQINIVFDLGKSVQRADFQLINIAGQIVFQQKLPTTEGLQNLQLPNLNLTSGLYLARVQFDGKALIQKIVIR